MSAGNIDLWVSSGNFEAPYYQFYTNAAAQKSSQSSHYTPITPIHSRTWRCHFTSFLPIRYGFKEASTDAITINGNGSPSAGITGDQAFTVSFNENAGDIVDLLYYCTSHSSMQGNIQLMEAFPAAPIIRGNSLYTIVDGPSWKEAQQHSASYGGHLAVISSAAENNIVLSLAQQVGNEVHIGYTDEVNEGLWVWVKD